MFCKIRKAKESYSIYLCERYRVEGKVVSKDIKIVTYAWHSLYEDDEDTEGLIEDIPMILTRSLRARLKNYDIKLVDVEGKLIEAKKEYYTTYQKRMIKVRMDFEKDEIKRNQQKLKEYEEFKLKYQSLYYQEISEKYQEGYLSGQLSNLNFGSDKTLDIDNQEKSLLKEAFKLLSHKHHPDKGGSTETMAMINNLKEKLL
ncbi:MAG: hypothetical protein RR835_05400 [Peptostreptococcaceae bacterium]